MRPSPPTSVTTWHSPVTGVTRSSSRAATPPSSDETGPTSSSSRPRRRMKVEILAISACITFILQEHIIVTQTTRLWRRLTWYSQRMCHFWSQTLPSKMLKITRILTTYGENNWFDLMKNNNRESYFMFRVLGISTAISIFALVTLVSGIGLLLVRHRSHKKQVQHLKVSRKLFLIL